MSNETQQPTEETKCLVTVGMPDGMGGTNYYKCGRPAKFFANYKSGVTGKKTSVLVCGVHANSLKAYGKRMMRKLNYDIGLTLNKNHEQAFS